MSSGDGFDAALAAVGAALDGLRGCATGPASDAVIVDALASVELLAARLDAERLRVLAEFDRRGLAAERGATSTAAWLRQHTRMSPATAAARVAVARAVRPPTPTLAPP